MTRQVWVGGDPGGYESDHQGRGDHRQLQLQPCRGPPVVQGLCCQPLTVDRVNSVYNDLHHIEHQIKVADNKL